VTLEPLHPTGRVQRVLTLGDRVPDALIPASAERATSAVDLVIIVPSPAELRRRGWLEQAATQAAAALRDDGFVYALAPRGHRRAAQRRLGEAGLAVELAVAQLPNAAAPRHLVPLRPRPWRYALGSQIGERPWVRHVLMAAGSGSLSAGALPAVAVVARARGARPLAAWIEGLDGETLPVGDAIVSTSWRGPDGPLIVFCFAADSAEPWGVAKLASASATEADLLERLGDAGGARVPRLLARGVAGGRPVLVETVVEGRSAGELLARSPKRFAEVTGAVADWLERWNRATAGPAPAPMETELLAPARALAGELPDGYAAWLADRCTALRAREIPLVARHNDLTMWNLRLDGGAPIGVLDWADAEDAGLPLTDLFYAVADAAAACDRYRDREAALRRSLAAVAPLRERLCRNLRLSPDVAELCFHACWLRHASNERRANGDGEFLAIMRSVARQALEASA
jgi:hypothetical protein